MCDVVSCLLPSREKVPEGRMRGERLGNETLRTFAKRMRREPTDAERTLWLILRARRFSGFKFRRQVPLGPYIADFVCFDARLIVEADGSQHADNARDRERDAWFVAQGFRVRRFWNADILARPGEVAETPWHDLAGEAPSSGASRHLLPQGEKE